MNMQDLHVAKEKNKFEKHYLFTRKGLILNEKYVCNKTSRTYYSVW